MSLPAHLHRSVRGWSRIAPGPHPWWSAAVATLAVGTPLAVTLAAGTPLLAAPATFGAMANLYGRTETYARRWRTQAWTGFGLTLAVLAGACAAALPLTGWVAVAVPAVVVAVVAVVAKFTTDAARTGPPAGLIPVFAAGTLGAAPLRPADLPAVAAVAVACAAFAVALSCAAGLVRPDGPERNAVHRAVLAVLDAREDPALAAGHRAVVAVDTAWAVLGPRGTGALGGWLAHAERLLHTRGRGADRPLRALLPLLAGRRALPAPPPGPAHTALPWPRRRVLTALRHPGALAVPALRVGIACAAAVLIAAACGLGHVYWAAVGAAAALQAPSAGVTVQRALQRAAGTVVGVGVAAVLVPLATGDLRLWLLTAACTFAVELCMPRNHALGTVAITSLSLLLTRLGATGAGVERLVLDRVGDTVVGIGVAVGVALLVRNARARHALDGALDALARAQDPHRLRGGLLALAEARARLADDDWRLPAPRAAADAERAGYARLGDLLTRPDAGGGTRGPSRP